MMNEMYEKACQSMQESKQLMLKLASVSDDWQARSELEDHFDELQKAMSDFARTRLGL